MKSKIFGVEGPEAEALAWALRTISFAQGLGGTEVKTRGGTSGATCRAGVWLLHNSAWWHWGGAKAVVCKAARRLANKSNENKLVLAGGRIISSEEEIPFAADVWGVASTSHSAWVTMRDQKRLRQRARAAGVPLAVFCLTQGWMEAEFASIFVGEYGDSLALAAVQACWVAVHSLPGEDGFSYPCFTGWNPDKKLSRFGDVYMTSLLRMLRSHQNFCLKGLETFKRIDGFTEESACRAMEALLKHYRAGNSIAMVYEG